MTIPPWVPDGHKHAPEPLLLVESFVNTRDLDLGTDLLAETGPANTWLRQAGLLSPDRAADTGDLQAARAVREGIRGLLTHNGGGPPPGGPELSPLRALAAEPLQLDISPDGQIEVAAQPDGRLQAGLLRLLVIIRDAQQDGSWPRLKACANPECRWAFFDRSHSRRGTWCDMASCGNLIKNRNLRARRRES